MEVYKEAHLLALQIESHSRNQGAQSTRPQDPWSQGVERFIQESKLKVHLFEKENEMKKSPRSLKRETYYLSESPLGPLPSGTQGPSGEGLQPAPAQASLPEAQRPQPSLPEQPSSIHLPGQAVTRKKVTSKLLHPRASSIRDHSAPWAADKVDTPDGPDRLSRARRGLGSQPACFSPAMGTLTGRNLQV